MARIGGPAVISSLLFTLYNLADAFWIGRLPKEEAGAVMAGIQISWPFVWFLISFVAGFGGAAVSALVAQYIGAGRPKEANFAMNQLFMLAAIAGVVLGVIPGLFYFAFSASGDTVTPLIVNAIGIVLNMALDPFLVLGIGPLPQMGILGAAYATVAAQGVTTLIFIRLLVKGKKGLRFDRAAILPRLDWMIKALRIGLPAAVGQSTVALGFLVLTGVIGRLPDAEVALAGYGIADHRRPRVRRFDRGYREATRRGGRARRLRDSRQGIRNPVHRHRRVERRSDDDDRPGPRRPIDGAGKGAREKGARFPFRHPRRRGGGPIPRAEAAHIHVHPRPGGRDRNRGAVHRAVRSRDAVPRGVLRRTGDLPGGGAQRPDDDPRYPEIVGPTHPSLLRVRVLA